MQYFLSQLLVKSTERLIVKKDGLLIFLVELIETNPSMVAEVTLVVGGLLITGTVVSKEKYFSHQAVPEAYNEFMTKMDEEDPPTPEDLDRRDLPNYIHLTDVHYLAPGAVPIPEKEGMFCRVALLQVQAFNFGRMVSTEKLKKA